MADQILKVNRRDLEIVFKNQRIVRAIEDLINSTQVILPDQVAALTQAIEEAALAADTVGGIANAASNAAALALSGVRALESVPVAPQVAQQDEQSGRLEALEMRVHDLAAEVEALKQGIV